MDVYLGKDRAHVTTDVTATLATLKLLTGKIVGHGSMLFMDSSVLLPDLVSDPTKKKFNCFQGVRPNRKECHRAVLSACFLLVSRLTYYSWTMKMGQYVPPKLLPDYMALHPIGSSSHLLLASILLGLPFGPEDEGSMFETSVFISTGLHGVTYEKIVLVIGSVCRLILADFMIDLLFDTEDGGGIFPRNVSGHLPDYMMPHPSQQ
jgi:hypothetical protein